MKIWISKENEFHANDSVSLLIPLHFYIFVVAINCNIIKKMQQRTVYELSLHE